MSWETHVSNTIAPAAIYVCIWHTEPLSSHVHTTWIISIDFKYHFQQTMYRTTEQLDKMTHKINKFINCF